MKQSNVTISASDRVLESISLRVPQKFTMCSKELHSPFSSLEMCCEFPDMGRIFLLLASGISLHDRYDINPDETLRRLYGKLTENGYDKNNLHPSIHTSHLAIDSGAVPSGVTYAADNRWLVSSRIVALGETAPNQLIEEHCLVASALATVLSDQSKKGRKSLITPSRQYFIGQSHALNEFELDCTAPEDPFERFKGIDFAVSEIREFIQQSYSSREELQKDGIEGSRSILLHGPSGVGKSDLISVIGEQLEAEVINVTMSDVAGSHIGEWAKNIAQTFEAAFSGNKITLIVLDEFDGLVCSGNREVTSSINAVLKTELDKLRDYDHVFLAAATNNLDAIDPLVLASKRFHCQIYVGLPNDDARREFFKALIVDTQLAEVELTADSADSSAIFSAFEAADSSRQLLHDLTTKTEGYSCSDIKEVVNNAKQRAFKAAKSHGISTAELIQRDPQYLSYALKNSRPTN